MTGDTDSKGYSNGNDFLNQRGNITTEYNLNSWPDWIITGNKMIITMLITLSSIKKKL